MPTLVLDVYTPNNDGPDGSFTRLLVAPITPELQAHVKELTTALQQARAVTPLAESVASESSHAHLIRPSRTENTALFARLQSIIDKVHATGVAAFDEEILTEEELATLRDETGDVIGMTLNRRGASGPTLRWTGNLTTDGGDVLAWKTAPNGAKDITQGDPA